MSLLQELTTLVHNVQRETNNLIISVETTDIRVMVERLETLVSTKLITIEDDVYKISSIALYEMKRLSEIIINETTRIAGSSSLNTLRAYVQSIHDRIVSEITKLESLENNKDAIPRVNAEPILTEPKADKAE